MLSISLARGLWRLAIPAFTAVRGEGGGGGGGGGVYTAKGHGHDDIT